MKNFLLFTFLVISVIYLPFGYKKQVNAVPARISTAKIIKNTTKSQQFPNTLNAGNPFITNYNLDANTKGQIWAILQDQDGAMLFGGNKGIIIFDGREWNLVKMKAEPLVMLPLENTEKVLVGCDNDYGYLQKDEKGVYTYVSLSSKKFQFGDITDIEITDEAIYFYSKNVLIQLKKSELTYQTEWLAEKNEPYEGIIKYQNQIYLKIKGKGIYKTEADSKLTPFAQNNLVNTEKILFNLPFSDNNTIIGTDSNKLYLFNDKKIEEYNIGFHDYLSENHLVDGATLADSLFVLSTISGGAIIVNKKSGTAKYTINYQTGLPDDEIFAIGKDKSGALWLSHEYGISRVNYNLPVYDYTAYPGIEGRLIDMIPFDSTIYIATTQGLYYLDTLTGIKESEVYVKKRIRVKSRKTETKSIQKESVKIVNKEPEKKKSAFERRQERKKKRLLKKLKAQGIQIEKKTEEKPLPEKKPVTVKQKYKLKYVKQKKYDHENLGYIFKKIKGIDFKCKQLVAHNNYLLVASINGLYIIHKNKTKVLLKNVYINQISPSSKSNVFYLATGTGVKMLIFSDNQWQLVENINPTELEDNILTVIEEDSTRLWLASSDIIYKLDISDALNSKIIGVYDLPDGISENISIRKIQNNLFFLAAKQIFSYNKKTNKIEPSHQLIPDTLALSNIYTQQDISWFKTKDKWVYISDYHIVDDGQVTILNIFDKISNIKIDNENNLWVIDGSEGIYKILPSVNNDLFSSDFQVFFSEIKDKNGQKFSLNKIEFEYEQKSFTFTIAAPFYVKQDAIEYQYFVEGVMSDWSDWRPRPDFDLIITNPGKFVVKVRARNVFGTISKTQKVVFKINAPFWLTTWFYILLAAAISIIIAIAVMLIIKKRERKLLKEKTILENKVRERTEEISKQKEEIEYKNKEITDSIYYARNIQSAVIPPINILDNAVDSYFVINKPRDIVSGDYYWLIQKNESIIITVADCTGHGVPGAFLSMLGMSALREITNNMQNLQAHTILDELRDKIIESLHQTGAEDERKDGMDMALCVLDTHNLKLQFAGAYNPLFIARDGVIEVLKGDRMPIGIHVNIDKPFTGYEIDVQEGDIFYLFSDGFVDQFGGEYNRKFLSKNFRRLLTEIQEFDMPTQQKVLLQAFEMWKGEEIQIDDILIVGIKI